MAEDISSGQGCTGPEPGEEGQGLEGIAKKLDMDQSRAAVDGNILDATLVARRAIMEGSGSPDEVLGAVLGMFRKITAREAVPDGVACAGYGDLCRNADVIGGVAEAAVALHPDQGDEGSDDVKEIASRLEDLLYDIGYWNEGRHSRPGKGAAGRVMSALDEMVRTYENRWKVEDEEIWGKKAKNRIPKERMTVDPGEMPEDVERFVSRARSDLATRKEEEEASRRRMEELLAEGWTRGPFGRRMGDRVRMMYADRIAHMCAHGREVRISPDGREVEVWFPEGVERIIEGRTRPYADAFDEAMGEASDEYGAARAGAEAQHADALAAADGVHSEYSAYCRMLMKQTLLLYGLYTRLAREKDFATGAVLAQRLGADHRVWSTHRSLRQMRDRLAGDGASVPEWLDCAVSLTGRMYVPLTILGGIRYSHHGYRGSRRGPSGPMTIEYYVKVKRPSWGRYPHEVGITALEHIGAALGKAWAEEHAPVEVPELPGSEHRLVIEAGGGTWEDGGAGPAEEGPADVRSLFGAPEEGEGAVPGDPADRERAEAVRGMVEAAVASVMGRLILTGFSGAFPEYRRPMQWMERALRLRGLEKRVLEHRADVQDRAEAREEARSQGRMVRYPDGQYAAPLGAGDVYHIGRTMDPDERFGYSVPYPLEKWVDDVCGPAGRREHTLIGGWTDYVRSLYAEVDDAVEEYMREWEEAYDLLLPLVAVALHEAGRPLHPGWGRRHEDVRMYFAGMSDPEGPKSEVGSNLVWAVERICCGKSDADPSGHGGPQVEDWRRRTREFLIRCAAAEGICPPGAMGLDQSQAEELTDRVVRPCMVPGGHCGFPRLPSHPAHGPLSRLLSCFQDWRPAGSSRGEHGSFVQDCAVYVALSGLYSDTDIAEDGRARTYREWYMEICGTGRSLEEVLSVGCAGLLAEGRTDGTGRISYDGKAAKGRAQSLLEDEVSSFGLVPAAYSGEEPYTYMCSRFDTEEEGGDRSTTMPHSVWIDGDRPVPDGLDADAVRRTMYMLVQAAVPGRPGRLTYLLGGDPAIYSRMFGDRDDGSGIMVPLFRAMIIAADDEMRRGIRNPAGGDLAPDAQERRHRDALDRMRRLVEDVASGKVLIGPLGTVLGEGASVRERVFAHAYSLLMAGLSAHGKGSAMVPVWAGHRDMAGACRAAYSQFARALSGEMYGYGRTGVVLDALTAYAVGGLRPGATRSDILDALENAISLAAGGRIVWSGPGSPPRVVEVGNSTGGSESEALVGDLARVAHMSPRRWLEGMETGELTVGDGRRKSFRRRLAEELYRGSAGWTMEFSSPHLAHPLLSGMMDDVFHTEPKRFRAPVILDRKSIAREVEDREKGRSTSDNRYGTPAAAATRLAPPPPPPSVPWDGRYGRYGRYGKYSSELSEMDDPEAVVEFVEGGGPDDGEADIRREMAVRRLADIRMALLAGKGPAGKDLKTAGRGWDAAATARETDLLRRIYLAGRAIGYLSPDSGDPGRLRIQGITGTNSMLGNVLALAQHYLGMSDGAIADVADKCGLDAMKALRHTRAVFRTETGDVFSKAMSVASRQIARGRLTPGGTSIISVYDERMPASFEKLGFVAVRGIPEVLSSPGFMVTSGDVLDEAHMGKSCRAARRTGQGAASPLSGITVSVVSGRGTEALAATMVRAASAVSGQDDAPAMVVILPDISANDVYAAEGTDALTDSFGMGDMRGMYSEEYGGWTRPSARTMSRAVAIATALIGGRGAVVTLTIDGDAEASASGCRPYRGRVYDRDSLEAAFARMTPVIHIGGGRHTYSPIDEPSVSRLARKGGKGVWVVPVEDGDEDAASLYLRSLGLTSDAKTLSFDTIDLTSPVKAEGYRRRNGSDWDGTYRMKTQYRVLTDPSITSLSDGRDGMKDGTGDAGVRRTDSKFTLTDGFDPCI